MLLMVNWLRGETADGLHRVYPWDSTNSTMLYQVVEAELIPSQQSCISCSISILVKTVPYLNKSEHEKKITLSSRSCFSDSRDLTVLSSFSRIQSLMFFDNPDNWFKLGCTLVMVWDESKPKVADKILIVLIYFSTLWSLPLFHRDTIMEGKLK